MVIRTPRMCVCGHGVTAHEHYRPGSECVSCAPGACPQFRADFWWRHLYAVRLSRKPFQALVPPGPGAPKP